MKHSREWVATYANAEVTTNNCNVVSLGGITRGNTNGLVADETKQKKEKTGFSYTNTTILNIIKVTIGFLPAFLTFMLTQNWWVLAWFGALIWFSITVSAILFRRLLPEAASKKAPVSIGSP